MQSEQELRGADIDRDGGAYVVGRNGITKIERFSHPGMYGDIPYILVWKGDQKEGEFCLHNIVGIYFFVGNKPAPSANISAEGQL